MLYMPPSQLSFVCWLDHTTLKSIIVADADFLFCVHLVTNTKPKNKLVLYVVTS